MFPIIKSTFAVIMEMSENNTKNNNEAADILSTINSPDDLRKLSSDKLPQLCEDIRKFLISSLSTNPGHFASSMGAVEKRRSIFFERRMENTDAASVEQMTEPIRNDSSNSKPSAK